ncbi:hypothetical protein [Pseudaestuariivita atlantica]|uniref:Uncharacterized protein n=1 Tax=Pseudaestuariivita atlantica TaxID=1317121 RepID=A0A0L1JTP4_9RHOB|nr:hypothetical protein [Pseudaestuariivita atlantica]KNG95144.1 hypothetical protein ATO11_00365 [Pseudaestuariivita atlantica]
MIRFATILLTFCYAAGASAFEVERPLPDCFVGDPTCGVSAGAGWKLVAPAQCVAAMSTEARAMAASLGAYPEDTCTGNEKTG